MRLATSVTRIPVADLTPVEEEEVVVVEVQVAVQDHSMHAISHTVAGESSQGENSLAECGRLDRDSVL